ncbi:unnamed protein product [Schistosoma margrebowiei]|uniref:Uncharacterized protein n=1 Tax=Schistosoma margrebowiei TaxID=48269 RepID=A0A183M2V7_9TREM|nr:unnamed protein product [Schistosoma margrebowiei]
MGRSNHTVIAFCFISKVELRHPTKRFDVSALQDYLQQVDWDVHPQHDVDAHWYFLLHMLLCTAKQSAAQMVLKIHKQPTIIKNHTLRLLSRKRHCWEEYKRTGNNGAYRQYKHMRNICTNAIRKDGLQYQIKLVNKFASNPKGLFHCAASLRQAKTGFSQQLGSDGPTNNDGDGANFLAEQYSWTFQPTHINYIEESFICNCTRICEVNLCSELVYRIMQHLRKDTSLGSDMVHSAVLREAASILATPLSVIFLHSLSRGKLPEI